ncbi:hypothetical protein [Micromonospora sp. NPDC005806]|uniref:hypothetical protein n=1 Tax=Micromonospora sp. NPDC005806 TaxID=3364234 RepID=UPI0036A6CE83
MQPRPAARLGAALRIMFAWWAALAAIAGVALLLSSTDHPTGCVAFCPSNRAMALFVIGAVGVPTMLIGLIVGTVLLRYRLQRLGTAFAAGTVAALTGLVFGLTATCSLVFLFS